MAKKSPEKPVSHAPSTSSTATSSPCFGSDPRSQPFLVFQSHWICDFRLKLGLSPIKTQQSWHACYQIRLAQSTVHDVLAVIFNFAERNAALLLADPRGYKFFEDGRDGGARIAVGGRPKS
jgi:hypothetical protein